MISHRSNLNGNIAETTVARRARSFWLFFAIVFVLRSAKFLEQSDEKPFRFADIAGPIRVSILECFAYELRAVLAKPFWRLGDVVHGKHEAEVACLERSPGPALIRGRITGHSEN